MADKTVCQFCGKLVKNAGLATHEKYCTRNPANIDVPNNESDLDTGIDNPDEGILDNKDDFSEDIDTSAETEDTSSSPEIDKVSEEVTTSEFTMPTLPEVTKPEVKSSAGIAPEVLAASQIVNIIPNQDLRTFIGNTSYIFVKGQEQPVPVNVRDILRRANMLQG